MKKIVYILTHDPKERIELVSSVVAQALTALGFEYRCEIFVMDKGVRLLQPEYIKGLKAETFDPLSDLLRHYSDMGGKIYGCNPFIAAQKISVESCDGMLIENINASKLIESSLEADAVFTY